jgi:hypothetical protein
MVSKNVNAETPDYLTPALMIQGLRPLIYVLVLLKDRDEGRMHQFRVWILPWI